MRHCFSCPSHTELLCTMYSKFVHALSTKVIDEIGLLPVLPLLSDLPVESAPFYPLVVVGTKLGIGYEHLSTLLKQAKALYDPLADHKLLEQVTRVMVLIKPDNYTAMNTRKKLVSAHYISIQDELELIDLIFTVPKHTKSSVAWYHRRWIHQWHQMNSSTCSMDGMTLEHELATCHRATTLYPKGYYSWNYRHWLLSLMVDASVLQKEYHYACGWVKVNVSDHSGVQHLERVVEALRHTTDTPLTLEDHLAWLDTLIACYPGHETLWYHRRYCVDAMSQPKGDCAHHSTHHAFVRDIIRQNGITSFSLDKSSSSAVSQTKLAFHFGVWLCLKERNSGSFDSERMKYYLEELKDTPASHELYTLMTNNSY
ncbi:hypothetical protein BDF14DRAFT_1756184 [Spinellus fusiger]|nr:hypothetical protein BDF14DRAFT_1756184 [Spinellus fusiger]